MKARFAMERREAGVSLIHRYVNVSPEAERKANESIAELARKHPGPQVKRFFDAALQLGAVNPKLMEKALSSAESFIVGEAIKGPDFEKRLMDAASALSYAMHHTKSASLVKAYTDLFEDRLLGIHRWQLWHLNEYAETAGNTLVFFLFLKRLPDLGRDPIDYRPLVEMAAKAGPENARDVFNGKSPDAEQWLKNAVIEHKSCVVIADHILHYLSVLANTLAGKPVAICPRGKGFSTDGGRIFVPTIYGMFPTHEENKGAYTKSTYHEAGHISSLSFVVDADSLDLSDAGWGFEFMGKDEGLKVFRASDQSSFFIAKTTMDLLQVFENPGLGMTLFNIMEDMRIDARVMEENPALAPEYQEGILRYLQFRPVAFDVSNPSHVIEAFLQLVIIGKTREEMEPGLKAVVMPLVEVAHSIPLDSPDATSSFHATIKVYNMLLKLFPKLETPDSVPMPEDWNESEDHSDSSDPAIVKSGGKKSKEEEGGEGEGKSQPQEGKEDGGQNEPPGIQPPQGGEKKHGKDGNGGEKPGEREEKKGKRSGGINDNEENPWKRGREIKGKEEKGGASPNEDKKGREGSTSYWEWDCEKKGYTARAEVHEMEVETRPGIRGLALDSENVKNAVKTAFRRIKPAGMQVKKGLPEGEEIDFEKLVEWTVEAEFGGQPEENFYLQRKKVKRSVAALLLVDASGSTGEQISGRRVITIENEACEIFSSALDELNDPHAICAYNSWSDEESRRRGDKTGTYFYVAKDFSQRKQGMPCFEPGNANRDGAAIRHATAKLLKRKEKKKLLILLSDGNPIDYGGYEGEYAIADTRKSIEEAEMKGVVVFCVSVRPEGSVKGLREIYGEGRVVPISDISKLPLILPLLYRKLTGV